MDIIAAIITDAQPSELVQQGKGLLHDVAVSPQPAAVFGVASGEGLADAPIGQRRAMRIAVIPAVAHDFPGFAQGPAGLAPESRNRVDQRQQLGHVVTVGPGEDSGQRDAASVDNQMVFRSPFGPVHGVGTRFFPPCTARTEAESTITGEKSMASAPRNRSSNKEKSASFGRLGARTNRTANSKLTL